MTKLAEFQSIKERDDVFDRTEITSFNNLLHDLKNAQGENVFFRGQASARWRIFSSIQREWIQQDLERYHTNIDDLVSGFLKFCRKKFKAELKETNDVTVFSKLQHYGAPTPFVDFTSNTPSPNSRIEISKVPPPRSYTAIFISLCILSRP